MQSLESFISGLRASILSGLDDPFASPVVWSVICIIITALIVWAFMRRRNRFECARVQSKAEQHFSKLQQQLRDKSSQLAEADVAIQENKRIKAEFELVSRQVPALEKQVEGQLEKITELTVLIEDGILNRDFVASRPTGMENLSLKINSDTLNKHEAVIGELQTSLRKELDGLHQTITDQSTLIGKMEKKLAGERTSLIDTIQEKRQQLPIAAREGFEKRVVEPIVEQIDGIKEKIQEIPIQTKKNIDKLIVDPVQKHMGAITSKARQAPDYAKQRVDQSIVQPLHNLLDNLKVTVVSLQQSAGDFYHDRIVEAIKRKRGEISEQGQKITEKLTTLNQDVINPVRHQVLQLKEKTEQLLVKQRAVTAG